MIFRVCISLYFAAPSILNTIRSTSVVCVSTFTRHFVDPVLVLVKYGRNLTNASTCPSRFLILARRDLPSKTFDHDRSKTGTVLPPLQWDVLVLFTGWTPFLTFITRTPYLASSLISTTMTDPARCDRDPRCDEWEPYTPPQ